MNVFKLFSLFVVFIIFPNVFFAQNICSSYSVTPGTTISSIGSGAQYNTVINVSDSFSISDVNVTIDISHTWNDDLDIYLISPSGTNIELSTDNGGSRDDYNNVTFDDNSPNTLPNGNSDLSGFYRPEEALSALNGEDSNGNWTLRVIDDASGDGGTINSITLNLCQAITPVAGYLGPGGVGHNDGSSGLIIWYRPDNGISTTGTLVDSWANSAGISDFDISESGTQRPTLVTNTINGYDEVSFNGSNRLRTGLTLTTSNFITNQASSFIVTRADNTTQQSSVYTTDPLVGSTRFSCHIPWSGTVYYDIGTCCSNDARIQVGGLSNLTSYSIWTYDAHPTTGKQLYRNQVLLQNIGNTSTYSSHASQRFNLGGNTSGTNGFSGDVTELVIFKTKINTAQRIIINNYLSAKYNTALTSEDYYNEDNSGSGDFDHHVAGIGQATDGSNHTDSQGTGIVRMSNPSDLDDDEYLFWGEETLNPTYSFSTNLNNYTEQLNSRWRVSRRGNIGSVTVSFNISNIDLSGYNNCSPLQLVIDSNADFSSPSAVYDLNISGFTATATGVNFNNNNYFTLRYTDQIVWDGTGFNNGSGVGDAPNDTDSCLKLTIKSGASAYLINNAHVREVEIENGASLIVEDGILLETENAITINTNGIIDLIGEAQLIQNHTGTSTNLGDGFLVKRQQGTTNFYNYNYWSAPVNRNGYWQIGYLEDGSGVVNFTNSANANPSTSPITLSNRWLYSYNGTAGNYYQWNQLSTNTNILPGTGFTMKGSGAATSTQEYLFKGMPNSGDYAYSIGANTEFLTGNPYPSAIDAYQFILDNLLVLDGGLHFWESFTTNNSHYLKDYQGGYSTLTLLLSLPATADASGLTSGNGTASKPAPTRYIPPAQGFFIKTFLGGTLEFNNAQRSFERESLNETVFYRQQNKKSNKEKKSDQRPKIWFALETPNQLIKTIGLGYDERTTYGYDQGFEAKLYDDFKDIIFWVLEDKEKLTVQGLPALNVNDTLPLGINVSTPGTYKLSISNMENIPETLPILLVDYAENTFYNLREGEVSLDLNKGNLLERFAIVFKTENLLGLNEMKTSNNFVVYNPTSKTLELHFSEALHTIEAFKIYNAIGQEVLNISSPESHSVDISMFEDGVYFLKVISKNEITQSLKFVKH
ncbi:proprotein convertase P-domain-containing protein [Tamlana crocina]|uniref:T9SS type A sorting domain-containing protein n=1 Tax=Tamlana crocina TaxID=393006 RepID=A0ABX1DEE4_9FLAO|nr:proprotein convertase P-domain-containing protein [Tamlana crocina]NJX16719.1 T9SS type A sorting domain-containing protein [Tamlana crocina]